MPDLVMCRNIDCPSRLRCLRFVAEPTMDRQVIADFRVPAGADRCTYILPLYEREEPADV